MDKSVINGYDSLAAKCEWVTNQYGSDKTKSVGREVAEANTDALTAVQAL